MRFFIVGIKKIISVIYACCFNDELVGELCFNFKIDALNFEN